MDAASSSLTFSPLVAGRPSKPGAGRSSSRVLAMPRRDSDDWSSRMVDENMIVLRKRIQEMKMMERNCEAPPHWMEWEKRYYASYYSDVFEGVGQLQRFLMGTRPCLALGLLVLLSSSIPVSVLAVLLCLIK